MEKDERESAPQRLLSLDALRGFDMIFILGFAGVVSGLASWVFGGDGGWLAEQMRHAEWVGFRHHDTIFPLFIFLAGVSYPFSCAASRAKGLSTSAIVWKATRRMFALVLLGLVYNGILSFDFANQRWPSVLARIGIAWYGAAMLHLFVRSFKARAVIAVLLLVGYWALCFFLVAPDAPDGTGPFSDAGCFVGYVDRLLLPGKFAGRYFDAEGIMSVISAVPLAMAGMFAGELVRTNSASGGRNALILAGAAAAFAVATFAWMPWCPVIKRMWTPTFITASVAYSCAMFALFYWVVDVRRWRWWVFPFQIVGMNAIAAYMFRRIVPVEPIAKFIFGGLVSFAPDAGAKMLNAAASLAVIWLFLWFLHRKSIFLKV